MQSKECKSYFITFSNLWKNEDYGEDKAFPFSDVISLQVHFKQKGSNEFN
jgi:hypothetical protein